MEQCQEIALAILLLTADVYIACAHCVTYRALKANPELKECFNGKDFVAAFADPAVRTVLIKDDIYITNDDFMDYKVPVSLDANLTVLGHQNATEQWPVLDFGNIYAWVRLGQNVAVNFSRIVVWNWRNSPHFQVPGMDFIFHDNISSISSSNISNNDNSRSGNSTVGGKGVAAYPSRMIVGWNAILVHRTCLPKWLYLQSVISLQRPLGLPPGPQNATQLTSENLWCDPDPSAPAALRCWPGFGIYYDVGVKAMDLDQYGNPEPSGYVMYLHMVQVKCVTVMNDSCMQTYGAVGCYYAMFPRGLLPGGSLPAPSAAYPSSTPSILGSGNNPPHSAYEGAGNKSRAEADSAGTGSLSAGGDSITSHGGEMGQSKQQEHARLQLPELLCSVLGGVVLLSTLSGIVFWAWRRRRRCAAASMDSVGGPPSSSSLQRQKPHLLLQEVIRYTVGGADSSGGLGRVSCEVVMTPPPLSSTSVESEGVKPGNRDSQGREREVGDREDKDGGLTTHSYPCIAVTASAAGASPPVCPGAWPLLRCLAPEVALEPLTRCTPLQPGLQLTGPSMQEQLSLLPGSLLGKGAFGRVVEGWFRGERVAVKMIDTGLLAPALVTWEEGEERVENGTPAERQTRDVYGAAVAAVASLGSTGLQGGVCPEGGGGQLTSICRDDLHRGCAIGVEGGSKRSSEEDAEGGHCGGSGCGGRGGLPGNRNTGLKSLLQEVEVLARCQHPNIVRLLAASFDPPRVCLVMELMDTSLDRLIHGHGKTPGQPLVVEAASRDLATEYGIGLVKQLLPLAKVIHIGIQIARALSYLHPTILHRDMKPANVLISQPYSDEPVAKLADFGLSRMLQTVLVTRDPEVGTGPYMAPEAFDVTNNTITDRADIYALGVILWEMLTGLRPWCDQNMVQIAFAVTVNENRLPLHGLSSERCPLKLRSLLATCWDHDPARRPAAAEVVKVLALVKEALDPGRVTTPRAPVSSR